jgi:hypothetical protein
MVASEAAAAAPTVLLEQILRVLVDWVVAEELKLPEVQEAQEERMLLRMV